MAWVIVTFKVPYHVLVKLDDVAASKRVSRSEVIREALEEYLSRRCAPRTVWRVKRVVLR